MIESRPSRRYLILSRKNRSKAAWVRRNGRAEKKKKATPRCDGVMVEQMTRRLRRLPGMNLRTVRT